MRQATVVESVLRRDRALVLAGIVAMTALAWVYLGSVAGDAAGMAGGVAMPATEPWRLTDLAVLFGTWAAMMIAMMVPSATPIVLTFATISRRQRAAKQQFVPTAVLLLGYMVTWAGFAAVAAGAQWGLHEAGVLSSRMGSVAPVLGGSVLVVAGAYQWTPLKRACLRQCRTPFAYLMTEWRAGHRGALVMGVKHGGRCLGCCWALMSLMFVGGVMSLLWMLAIATYVLVEKVTPDGHRVDRLAGLVLMTWGIWTLAQSLAT